jgi:hypothetical protein
MVGHHRPESLGRGRQRRLLSPAAAAITGQDIQICGGASLPR